MTISSLFLQVIARENAVKVFILLDLLSWMCDGQNKTMQDLLRKQDTGLSVSHVVHAHNHTL